METLFSCPICGSIHRTELQGKMIFGCKHCDHLFIVNEDGPNSVRSMNSEELRSLDTEEMLGLPGQLRINKGIPIPMINGTTATLRIKGNFYHVPKDTTIQDILYTAMSQGEDPTMLSLEELLQRHLGSENCIVDVWKLQSLLGSIRWERINKEFNFLVE